MVEDIIKIISNGFETYTKNLNLSIPFVLNAFISGLLAVVMFGLGFFYIFGLSLSSLKNAASPEAVFSIILSLVAQHILEIIFLVLVTLLIIMFFGAFFTAGAIGMAKQAIETGKCEFSTMMEAGKRNVVSLYLAEILVGLINLAGIVFIVPGAMRLDVNQLLSSENTGSILLLIAGIFLWLVYIIILSLVLAAFSYALIIENLGPMEAIAAGFRFFNKHKLDVFLLWLFMGAIVVVIALIGQFVRPIPIVNFIWPIVNFLISAIIIPPLVTVWWVRLYMSRTGKKLYFNELLAHPNDLKSNP